MNKTKQNNSSPDEWDGVGGRRSWIGGWRGGTDRRPFNLCCKHSLTRGKRNGRSRQVCAPEMTGWIGLPDYKDGPRRAALSPLSTKRQSSVSHHTPIVTVSHSGKSYLVCRASEVAPPVCKLTRPLRTCTCSAIAVLSECSFLYHHLILTLYLLIGAP